MTAVPSEKCVAGWGSAYDEIRVIIDSFVRVLQRGTGHLCRHILSIFQQVGVITKTCNQLGKCSLASHGLSDT